LDELPTMLTPATTEATPVKEEPAIKKHFTLDHTGVHTYGGTGKLAGKVCTAYFFLCKRDGCPSSHVSKVIKQVGNSSGQLFRHIDQCQPALATALRAASKNSPVEVDEDGNE
jgi:hypothetical protein